MGDPRTRSDDTTPTPRATLAAAAALAGGLMLDVGHAAAQKAMVVVSHDDPDGVVSPGESVEITTTVSWTSGSVLGLGVFRGSVLASPNAGIASTPRVPPGYSTNSYQTINPGSAWGGSVTGIYVDPFILAWAFWQFPIQAPWGQATGVHVHRFDWTAPAELGMVSFQFEGDPGQPDPTFLSHQLSLVTLPTTYLGTSLTVIPAPPAAAVAGLGLTLAAPRRRRPARERRSAQERHPAWGAAPGAVA